MSRKQSPLFELINKSGDKPRRGFSLPAWMKPQADDAPAVGEPDAPSTAQPPAEPPALRSKAEPVTKVQSWLRQPTLLRLPRGGLLLLVATLVAVVMIAFWAGRSVGEATASQEIIEHNQAINALGPLQEQAINPQLIPMTVEGVGRPSITGPDGVIDVRQAGGGDPRKPGYNYFRLMYVADPAKNREDLDKAVAFLTGEGVDTAVVGDNNGRSLKLVALPGFLNPRSDRQAVELEQKLKTLGRKWKAQHRGSSDWRDLYPEKYRPGVN